MPIYEWLCPCGNTFETKWNRPSRKKTEVCGKCGGKANRKPSIHSVPYDRTVKEL